MKGYILIARAIQESAIWDKPHFYIKAWIYILLKAAFKPYNNFEIGECFITTEEIQKSCAYKVGRRIEQPSKKQIRDFIDFLKSSEGHHEGNNESHPKGAMIVTKKVKGGMLIKVLNYGKYQDPNFYESNNECDYESHPKVIRKSNESHPKVSTKIETLETLETLEALEDPFKSINNAKPPDKPTEEMTVEELEQSMLDEENWIQQVNIIECWEEGFHAPPSSSVVMRLQDDIETHGIEKTYCALREAVLYGKKSIDYVETVLLAWKDMTAEQILNGERPKKED